MKLIWIISLILSSITQYPTQVTAQTQKVRINKQPVQPTKTGTSPKKPTRRKKPSSRPVFVPPKAPSGLTPISGRRRGMGSRNNCPAVKMPLTALAPFQGQQVSKKTNKSNIGIVGGLTSLERPSFWFYVPYTTQNLTKSTAEFSLQDSKGIDIHRIKTALPLKPSIIGISLPNTVSLKTGQNYRWYFKVRCNDRTTDLAVYVEGYIQRINLNSRVTEQLNAARDPRQKSRIYGQKGIWFDALNILAQARQSSQDASVKEDWQSLLQSVNLDRISTAPLVNSTNQE